MTLPRSMVLAAAVVLLAAPAQARFGKSSGSSSKTSSSSSASTSGATRTTTSSSSSSNSSSSSSSSSGGDYHSAVPVGSGSGSSSSSYASPPSSSGWWGRNRQAYRYGYYSGAFVPRYGYGYAACPMPVQTCATCPPVAYEAGATTAYGYGAGEATVQSEPASVRLSAGVEGMGYVNSLVGVTLGLSAMFEGEHWGFGVAAQNISVRAEDGSNSFDNIPQLNLHLTYAFLSGRYGRLRAELGADTIWAADLTVIGATGGLSGNLWIGGPFAIEGSAMVTVYPYWQLDYRAGLVLGLGPVGIRGGWRTQVLDDRGLVDGEVHRDVFMGPYVGVGIAF